MTDSVISPGYFLHIFILFAHFGFTTMMSNCDKQLPNLLKATLEQVLSENKLLKWNLQAHSQVVYVNLCFVPLDFSDDTYMSTPVPGFRKKTPSQAKRDFNRYKQWQGKSTSNSDELRKDSHISTLGDKCKRLTRILCD